MFCKSNATSLCHLPVLREWVEKVNFNGCKKVKPKKNSTLMIFTCKTLSIRLMMVIVTVRKNDFLAFNEHASAN